MEIQNKITFPEFTGAKCNMMPFIQGDSSTLPPEYQPYAGIINDNYLEKGKIGLLTIDESLVGAGVSQRGYNSTGSNRNVHIEVGQCASGSRWGSGGGNGWGGKEKTMLEDSTQVLIANSIDDTCRVWDAIDRSYTKDGDLSHVIDKYPEESGVLMKAGEVARMSIFTPHECIRQIHESQRQFIRIVGKGVAGREDHFTINPLLA